MPTIISGAKYSGVPHKVHVLEKTRERGNLFVIPKINREREKKEQPVVDFFGKAKIAQPHVALAIDEQILGLQVSIDDGERVEIVESAHDFGREEHGRLVGKLGGVAQIAEQLAAAHVLQ